MLGEELLMFEEDQKNCIKILFRFSFLGKYTFNVIFF